MIAFTKEQLSEVMCKHAEKENGLHDLLEIILESLMVLSVESSYGNRKTVTKGMDIAWAILTDIGGVWSFGYRGIVSGTPIRRSWPS